MIARLTTPLLKPEDRPALKLLAVMGLFCLPFLLTYSEDLATTLAKFTCDEIAFSENLHILWNCLAAGKLKGFAYNCVSFGYGPLFWVAYFFAALPGLCLGNDQVLIIGVRLFSLVLSLASFFLIDRMMRQQAFLALDQVTRLATLLLAFFTPIVVSYSNMLHPEILYAFFIICSTYALSIDNGEFGYPFYCAVSLFSAACATKLLAGLSCSVFLVYWATFRTNCSIRIITKATALGIASLLLLHAPLFLPLVRARFFAWVSSMAVVVRSGLPSATDSAPTLLSKLAEVSRNYGSLPLLGILVCLFIAVWRLQTSERTTWLHQAALCVITSHLIFLLFYCWHPYHYGIALSYFIPLVVARVASGLQAITNVRTARAVLAGLGLLNLPCTAAAASLLLFPSGTLKNQKIHAQLFYLHDFVAHLPQASTIGVPVDFRLKRVPNKLCREVVIDPATPERTKDCDIIFFSSSTDYFGTLQLGGAELIIDGAGFQRVENNLYFSIYERIDR